MRSLLRLVAGAMLLAVVACWSSGSGGLRNPILLEGSDALLRESFDDGLGRVRLVAILSPTCASCSVGIREVARQVLQGHPGAKIRVHLVWGSFAPSDSLVAVNPWLVELNDPRVEHYWDPESLVGTAYAPLLGIEEPPMAWDVYMFFPGTVGWTEEGPPPVPEPGQWAHQMQRTAAEHQHTGEELGAFLGQVSGELLAEP